MYSTFIISKSDCMTCTNKTLKSLETLRGVFGADIDQFEGKVLVSHTDEISRKEIAEMLLSLGYPEQERDVDKSSVWGCAL